MKKNLQLTIRMFVMLMAMLTFSVSAQSSDTITEPKYKTWKQAKAAFNLEKAKVDFDLAFVNRTQEYYFTKWGSKKNLTGCNGNNSELRLDTRKRHYEETFYDDYPNRDSYDYYFSSKTGNLELFYMGLEYEHVVSQGYYYYGDDKNLTFYVIYEDFYNENEEIYQKIVNIIHCNEPHRVIRYEVIKDINNHHLYVEYNAKKNTYKIWRYYFNDKGYWTKVKGKIKVLVTGNEDFIQRTEMDYNEWELEL